MPRLLLLPVLAMACTGCEPASENDNPSETDAVDPTGEVDQDTDVAVDLADLWIVSDATGRKHYIDAADYEWRALSEVDGGGWCRSEGNYTWGERDWGEVVWMRLGDETADPNDDVIEPTMFERLPDEPGIGRLYPADSDCPEMQELKVGVRACEDCAPPAGWAFPACDGPLVTECF